MTDKSIMPECYADTLLIETLVPTQSGYNHKHNCFKVESEMSKGKLKDKFALGIIDNDKKTISYIKEFEKISSYENDLVLWKHNCKHHYIIQICPALEQWIITLCRQAAINISEYGLENTLEGLKKHTKSIASLKDKKLKNLFKEIKNKSSEITSVRKLITWISLLKDNHYNIDVNELKNV